MNRNDGSPARLWPWVVGLGIAAVAVWLGVAISGREGPPEVADPAAGPATTADTDTAPPAAGEPVIGAAAGELVARTEEMRAAVRRYESECGARIDAVAGEGLGDLVVECVDHLIGALEAIAATDTVGEVAIDDRLKRYRNHVARLRWTAPGRGRAEPTREVLRSVADVVAVIRDERYPETLAEDGAMDDLRSAIGHIDPDRPLDRQRDPLRRYFLGAGGLLSAMARPEDPGPGS